MQRLYLFVESSGEGRKIMPESMLVFEGPSGPIIVSSVYLTIGLNHVYYASSTPEGTDAKRILAFQTTPIGLDTKPWLCQIALG